MRPKGTAEELEERRRKCFELLDSGKTAKEIAGILGVSRVSIQRWKAMVREGGKSAIRAIPQSVSECRLSPEQQRQRGKIITAGALKEGFPSDLWTTKRITEVIWKRFNIQYNCMRTAKYRLTGMGYCWLSSQRRTSHASTSLPARSVGPVDSRSFSQQPLRR